MTGHIRLSYSAAETYARCPKSYQLRKIRHAPERPGWARIGGSAVHAATEAYDRRAWRGVENLTAADLFTKAYADAIEDAAERSPEYPESEWDASGRASKEYPNKQDSGWWDDNGPAMVQAWIDWRAETGWDLAEYPDADGVMTPAIEVELRFALGDVDMLGYIDRVFRMPDGSLAVVDLKAGSREPESNQQLGEYAVGYGLLYGEKPTWGCYWMARRGQPTALEPMSRWTVPLLTALYTDTARGIQAESFRPHLSGMCRSCSVRDFCAVYGGARAPEYDPLAQLEGMTE